MIRRKLEDVRQFALTLPVASVGEVAEFRGKDCDFQSGQQEGQTPAQADARDPHRWAKIQASRHVESPWRPGASRRQSPSHMMCLSIHPAEGCEQMNVGWCSYPRFVWKPEKDHLPSWSLALASRDGYRQSEKILRAFLRKYRLVKIPDTRGRRGRSWGRSELLHYQAGGGVSVRSGRYLSHRRG
jgi:hypothetical protein